MRRFSVSLLVTALLLASAASRELVQAQDAATESAAAKKAVAASPRGTTDENAVVQKNVTVKKAAPAPKNEVPKKLVEPAKVEALKQKEAAVRKAIVARNRRVVAINANGNVNPMIQQYVQQGRPMMRSEVLLVHTLHHLPKDRLKELLKGAEAGLEKVAKEMAEYQQQGGMVRGMRGMAPTTPDWGKKLEEAIAIEFQKRLTPDQFARYQAEVDKRTAERKEIGLRFLIDAIDRELLLSPQQRERLLAALGPKWDGGWVMYLEYIMYGNQFFPQDIDRIVTAVLDETQRKVWQGTQKVSGFWGFGGMWGFQNGEDPLVQVLGEDNPDHPQGILQPATPKGAVMKKAAVAKKQAAGAPVSPKTP